MTTTALVAEDDEVVEYDDPTAARDAGGTAWVHAVGNREELEAVAEIFGVHPLSVEDVTNGVRPKTETFDAHTFVLVKTGQLVRGDTAFDEEVRERSVGVVVGDDWVLTMTTTSVPAVERMLDAAHRREGRGLRHGPDFVAYRVVDSVVDGYFDVLDEIGDAIEAAEDAVLEQPSVDTLTAINAIRRDLLSVRKLLWPTREALNVLARGDPEQLSEPAEKYFRDVYDHTVQLVDLVETYRDLAAGARDIYLNRLTMSTNEVMKTLTVVATIVLPLTLVTGIYGMNFGDSRFNMPELGWTFGYPAVMVGMGLVALVMIWRFRRVGWL